jgi:hypothetical protein
VPLCNTDLRTALLNARRLCGPVACANGQVHVVRFPDRQGYDVTTDLPRAVSQGAVHVATVRE